MDGTEVMGFIKESAFMLSTFGVLLVYGMAKGRYALVNVILALYLAFLVTLKFPYYASLGSGDAEGGAIAKILIFLAITIVGIMLFRRLIPGDDYEPAFAGLSRKMLLAIAGTILVMIFSFHALPVTEIITPGTPIQALFASPENFFWWLMLPLAVLFFA